MKATFRLGIRSLSGAAREEGVVFMSFRNGNVTVVRTFVYPRFTTHNQVMAARMKVAASLWRHISVGFREGLEDYAHAYNIERRSRFRLLLHPYNFFTRAVMRTAIPISNISVLAATFGENLEEWIEAGFLEPVQRVTPNFKNPIEP